MLEPFKADAPADDETAISNPSAAARPLSDDDVVHPWMQVTFASRSPGSRVFPSAVVHDVSLYIFGGHDGGVYRNDLLVFNLETRAWLLDLDFTGGGPSPRDAHAAVVHDEWMYVFGGYDSKRYLNDFHRLRFETCAWSSVTFGGGAPSPRAPLAQIAPWNPWGVRCHAPECVCMRQSCARVCANPASTHACAGGGHTAVVHADEMLVFGGCDGWNYFNDLFKFSFEAEMWVPVRVTGTAPGARSAPATVIHESQQMMFVFGGYDGKRRASRSRGICVHASASPDAVDFVPSSSCM